MSYSIITFNLQKNKETSNFIRFEIQEDPHIGARWCIVTQSCCHMYMIIPGAGANAKSVFRVQQNTRIFFENMKPRIRKAILFQMSKN